jgi:threonine dehydrogenase-like Zn-dependent dehydrogenase
MQMVPGAQTINFAQEDLHKTLLDMTGGSGPDVGVEAVGMHYTKSVISKVHQATDDISAPASRAVVLASWRTGTLKCV